MCPVEERNEFSGYKAVWLFAIFDLPVTSKKKRKLYANFRKTLLKSGFTMIQYSVYARFCGSEDASEKIRKRIRAEVPPAGHVRLLAVTDKQFGKMEIFYGKKTKSPENAPEQLSLF